MWVPCVFAGRCTWRWCTKGSAPTAWRSGWQCLCLARCPGSDKLWHRRPKSLLNRWFLIRNFLLSERQCVKNTENWISRSHIILPSVCFLTNMCELQLFCTFEIDWPLCIINFAKLFQLHCGMKSNHPKLIQDHENSILTKTVLCDLYFNVILHNENTVNDFLKQLNRSGVLYNSFQTAEILFDN